MFSTVTGRPLCQRNFGYVLADAAEAAGLGKVAPHDLRRSFCSLAAHRGVDPVQAGRLTGHSFDVFVRHCADDYGKAHRDEARARLLSDRLQALARRRYHRRLSLGVAQEKTRRCQRVCNRGAEI